MIMIGTGFMIFLEVGLLLLKLPRRTALRILKYPLMLDIAVTVLVLMIHWGTFSGVMAATVAGLMMSLATSSLRRMVGYADSEKYYPGKIRLDV
jgi:NhaP-type Na+/H+ or K+/H+ antiporter